VDHDLAILSPEKTILTYRLAGLGARVGAHLIDLLAILTVIYALAFGLSLLFARIAPDLVGAVVILTISIFPFVYFIFLEGLWNGQTLGKKAAGIRVRMADGTPITFNAALGRNLLRPADMVPGTYFVGLLAIFTNPRSQRIGDLVANTVVTYERRAAAYFQPAPHRLAPQQHPFEEAVGPLRGMTQDEYDALRRMCDRFPDFTATTQARLLEEVWRPIADRRGVPEVTGVHPIYLAEAMVMRYGRERGLL